MDRGSDRVSEPALRESLSAFDDAALATLANPGLVRRAHRDVEEGKIRLLGLVEGKAELEADGQRVLIDHRGPRLADCACRSVAICRHRLAAVIYLRDLEPEEATPATETKEGADPAGIVLELDLGQLAKWAGKAGWRAALEVAPGAERVEPSANAVAVHFAEIEGPVRILRGQGFAGIVSKASKARIKAYHAAAVLAARAHFGAGLPEAVVEPEVESSRDIAIDPAFLARVGDGLADVAALGMNLAPLPLEESLFELSVSSRADSLPRLAAILRAMAAQIRLRRNRALDFDPDRLLELAATAFSLVQALGAADARRKVTLAGKLRRDFEPAEPLRLVGCGGERWTTVSGARGVTAWFIEPESGRWLSTTLARGPGQDPNFIPRDAWQTQPMWHSEPLAVLAHARIDLTGSRRSADNRLSAPAAARAEILERAVTADPAWPGIVRDWAELRQNWLDQVGLGLDSAELPAACLIAPSQIAPPFFDELAQQLVWPVRDRAGSWLALTLDHEGAGATAIETLEAHVRSGWQGMVLVRMERSGDRLALRPITLFGRDEPVDLSLWQRPWRRGEAGKSSVRDWLARLRPDPGRRFEQVPRSGTDAALAKAWRHLLDRAEVGPSLARTLDPELVAHADRLETFGLVRLSEILRKAAQSEELLGAAYGLMLARQQRCAAPLLR
jgi:hypothetical protein